MKAIKLLTATVLLGLGATSLCHADESKQCKVLHWKNDKIFNIKSSINHATHIMTPKELIAQPIVGSQELWDAESSKNHAFIKPNSKAQEGKSTTLSLIDSSGVSYDFYVTRVDANPDTCIRIIQSNHILPEGFMSGYESKEEKEVKALMAENSALRLEQARFEEVSKEQSQSALKNYRNMIYTRYKVKNAQGFVGTQVVTDVWDDGRFTYLRLNTDNKGLFTVSAKVEGGQEMLEYKYDKANKIYRIPGIFPKLVLSYGKSHVDVIREDSITFGDR